MTTAVWGISLLWILVFIYAIAGSVDFGAGFWAWWYSKEKNSRAATIANRYLSPLWEVTNVFLVLFAVAMVGLFPKAAFTFGNILLIPGNLILVLLTIRTVFMVYTHSIQRYQTSLRFVSGLTGLLIPALLLTVFPIAQGGFIHYINGNYVLSVSDLFKSPVTYSYIFLGLLSELFLSVLILADYSRIAEDVSAFRVYRRNALWIGPIAMISAWVCLYVIYQTAPWLRERLLAQSGWFFASGVFFIISMFIIWFCRSVLQPMFRLGVISVVIQYGLAMFAFGRAHLPYLLYPLLTVENSFTNYAMFRAVVIVMMVGIAILFPGFIWFWRLFLENKAYVGKS